MKKASKLISMLLSAAMVCTLLAGCGNSGGSAQDGSAGKESVSPSADSSSVSKHSWQSLTQSIRNPSSFSSSIAISAFLLRRIL